MKTFRQYFREANIDNIKGWGSVPYNLDVGYRGLKVFMTPKTFLSLALDTSSKPSKEMLDHIRDGGSIGAPFLMMRVPENFSEPAQIVNHEGRHRMKAILEIEGNKPVEVHLFPRGEISRNRHITPDVEKYLKKSMYKEQSKTLMKGPLWK